MKKLAVCLILFSFNLKAEPFFNKKYRKSCSKYVNLMRRNWSMHREVPNLDQGPVGICYSHAATTLIDMYRDIHMPKYSKRIALSNPQYTALLYHMEYPGGSYLGKSNTLDGGWAQKAIDAVRKHGMCRFDVINRSMQNFSKENQISTRDWYAFTEWFLEFYDKKTQRELQRAPNKSKALKDIFSRYTKRKRIEDFYNYADFTKIFNSMKPYLLTASYKDYAKDVFGQCFKKENIYLPTKRLPKIITHRGIGGKAKRIIKELDKKNPVGITYTADVLRGGRKWYHDIKYFWKSPNHQSVIVGKRVRNKKCEFLLKNSWGNYCKYSWECQKDPGGRELGIWMDADTLMTATSDIFYFDVRK
ncbi:MAG: hypothetical protein E2O68_00250 [Deltaproteobacteria bacterium]|nr:MAG: hypothetical protein E2O68_00250 [Deltaproteobacteria bacterium]